MTATATNRKIEVNNRDDRPAKWFFGGQTWLHATQNQTNGGFSMIEQIADAGTGSPYHLHRNEDEAFYVIEGSMRFVSEGTSIVAGPGSWTYLPVGIPHGFEVVGNQPARYLLFVTPSGFEQFVTNLWEDAPAPPDMARVMPAAAAQGLEILGPLPQE